MNKWTVTQLIVLEKLGGDRYFFHYPMVNLPNMCAICGEKADAYVPLDVRGRKIINTSYTIARRLDKMVFAEMKFQIPLCHYHDKEIKDHKIEQEKLAKESIILLGVSILVSILAVFFAGFQNSDTPVAGKILISIFLGGLGGTILLWPIIGMLIPALVRLALHKKYMNPFFTNKDFGFPTAEIPEIFNNDVTLKLIFTFSNKKYCQEFMRQSNVEKQLLAAMYHPDSSVHGPALEALAANGCTGAAPEILRKFIEDIGKAGGTCWEAARTLEKLGIPQPVDKLLVDQLAAGLSPANTRELAAKVMLLCGTENAIAHLQDPDADARIALLKAFGNKRLKEAVPAIIPLLSDAGKSGRVSVADEAAKTLKKIGTPEALAAVEK